MLQEHLPRVLPGLSEYLKNSVASELVDTVVIPSHTMFHFLGNREPSSSTTAVVADTSHYSRGSKRVALKVLSRRKEGMQVWACCC